MCVCVYLSHFSLFLDRWKWKRVYLCDHVLLHSFRTGKRNAHGRKKISNLEKKKNNNNNNERQRIEHTQKNTKTKKYGTEIV